MRVDPGWAEGCPAQGPEVWEETTLEEKMRAFKAMAAVLVAFGLALPASAGAVQAQSKLDEVLKRG